MITVFLEKLRDSEKAVIVKVGDAGPQGLSTFGCQLNCFSLLILHRKNPGIFTGFSVEEDPSGWRVTLTERGFKLRDAILSGDFE